MASGIYLDIDASDLNEKIDRLRNAMTEQQFKNAMYGIFKETGGHVKKILKEDLPHKYEVKPKEIGAAVKNPKVTTGGLGVGCAIPIAAARKSIGGSNGFSASGGARGWESVRRKYRVIARIVKSGRSTLPQNMGSYGGQPPFRNLGPRIRTFNTPNGKVRGAIGPDGAFEKRPKSKLGKGAFTRVGKDRLPIVKVSGIAIPQMPMNRSEPEVQKDIKDYLESRMEHRFTALMKNGK